MRYDAERIVRDERFILIGRRDEAGDPLRLFWVGSGVVINAKLTSLSVRVEADWSDQVPWMVLALDDAPVARFPLRRGVHEYALLAGMDPAISHRIRLTRDTQPMENDERLIARIREIEIDGELLPPVHRRRIEFIGDSLTSGEGLAGPVGAAEWKTAWMSGAKTYAAQVCAMLDSEGEWISQSGWGIVTDWMNDRRHTLRGIYSDICALIAAGHKPYDFAAHPVDAVVINLGTNDGNAIGLLKPEERVWREQEIVAAVRAFLEQIRAVRPGVPILWTCGMCGDAMNNLLEHAVNAAAQALSDDLIAFCALPACKADELGSLGHPGYLSHRRCAELIAQKLALFINPVIND